MTEVRVAKPAAGQQQNIACGEQAQFVFAFAPNEATITREGDNLNIAFDDGGSVSLDGFYSQYNSENLPSFNIDGMEVSAEDFFTAMNEPNLMPAAGPATNTSPTAADGARYHEYADSSLLGGLTHLEGLDWNTTRAFAAGESFNAVGSGADTAGFGAETVLSAAAAPQAPGLPGNMPTAPENSATPPADIPPQPVTPDRVNHQPSVSGARHVLQEENLADGTSPQSNPNEATGTLSIESQDGLASIRLSFGGGEFEIPLNGDSVEITPEGHAEGTLTARYDAASGELHYTYTLKQATQEHTVKGKDSVEHDFTVTVTDTDGDEASSVIKIQIVDDVPVLTLEAGDAGEYGKPVMIGHLDARYGADGKAEDSAISLKLGGKDAQHDGNGNYVVDGIGTIRIAENGDIFFEPEYRSGGQAEYKLEVTITDGDGDSAAQTIDFKINPTDTGALQGSATSSDEYVANGKPVEVNITLPDGAKVPDGTYEGEYGTLTVKDGKCSYVQNKPFSDHQEAKKGEAGKDTASGADKITDVKAILEDGTEVTFTVNVDIVDDVPLGGSFQDDVTRGKTIEGNIFEGDNPANPGADGLNRVEWKLPEGWKWADGDNKTYGEAVHTKVTGLSVTLDYNGHYVFKVDESCNIGNLPSDVSKYIAFDHKIYDQDGDWDEGKLEFHLSTANDLPDTPPLPESIDVVVSEAGLDNGSKDLPKDQDGKEIGQTAALPIPEGYEVIDYDNGQYGEIVKNDDGSLSYKLTRPYDNTDGDGTAGEDTVKITLKDAAGKTHDIEVKIEIIDDEPSISLGETSSPQIFTDDSAFGTLDFTCGGNHDKYATYISNNMSGSHDNNFHYGVEFSNDNANWVKITGYTYSYSYDKDDKGQSGPIILTEDKEQNLYYSNSTTRQEGDSENCKSGALDGLTVGTGDHEIKADIGLAEGVCFDFGDKLAHMANLSLGAFFSEAHVSDQVPEKALLTFYRGDTIVYQEIVESGAADGKQSHSFDIFVAGGFDKAVVSALDNSNNGAIKTDSDFVIQSATFKQAYAVTSGKVAAIAGADGFANMDIPVSFDLAAMQKEMPLVSINGHQYAVRLENGPQPNQVIGRLHNGELFFVAALSTSGGWELMQYIPSPIDKLPLVFRTADSDGDTARQTAHVELVQADDEFYLHLEHQIEQWSEANDGNFDVPHTNIKIGDGGYDEYLPSDMHNTLNSIKEAEIIEPADIAKKLEELEENPYYESHYNDKMTGGEGSDVLMGMGGHDQLVGGEGDDLLYGGSGDDLLEGGNGNDTLFGGSGNDYLDGGEGDDLLFGGAGDDTLHGGAGSDYLDGGEGSDYLDGGADSDLIVYDPTDYLIDGGDGIDFLLAPDQTLSLGEILSNTDTEKGPIVKSVEVLVRGKDGDIGDITSMDKLAAQGISLSGDGKQITLGENWKKTGEDSKIEVDGKEVNVSTYTNGSITLETTLNFTGEDSAASAEQVAQAIVLSSNG